MKKTTTTKCFSTSLLLACLAFASTGWGDVIYEDSFTGATGTPLNTREPDMTNQPGKAYSGSAAPRLMANHAVTVGNACVSLPLPSLQEGSVIRFSADVHTAGENLFGYIGLGFAETPDARLSHDGILWANIMNGGFARVWQGPAEPKGAGIPLYSDKQVVANTSGGSSSLEFSFNTKTQDLVVSVDGYEIFNGAIDYNTPEKLKYLVIQFNDVNTSNVGSEGAAYIDNLTVSID